MDDDPLTKYLPQQADPSVQYPWLGLQPQDKLGAAQGELDDWVTPQPSDPFDALPAAPGTWTATKHAAQQGLGEAVREYGQTAQALRGEMPEEIQQSPYAAPLEWGTPSSSAIPKLAYRLAKSAPSLAGGIAGGSAGSAAGSAVAPGPGTVIGGIAGGAAGAGIATAAQELGPYFRKRYLENPGDPDAAFNLALEDASISGAFSGAGWAAFPLRAFSGPIKQILFQAFAVQPGVGLAHQAVTNLREGQPLEQGMSQAYLESAAGTAVPMIGHHVVAGGARALRGKPGEAAPVTEGAQPATAEVQQPVAPEEVPGQLLALRDDIVADSRRKAQQAADEINRLRTKGAGKDRPETLSQQEYESRPPAEVQHYRQLPSEGSQWHNPSEILRQIINREQSWVARNQDEAGPVMVNRWRGDLNTLRNIWEDTLPAGARRDAIAHLQANWQEHFRNWPERLGHEPQPEPAPAARIQSRFGADWQRAPQDPDWVSQAKAYSPDEQSKAQAAVDAGKGYDIDAHAHDNALQVISGFENRLPPGVNIGVLRRVEPGPSADTVKLSATNRPDFTLNAPRQSLDDTAAIWDPGARKIIVTRFGTRGIGSFGEFAHGLQGETLHELAHAVSALHLTAAERRAFISQADALKVLNVPFVHYASLKLGRPTPDYNGGATLRNMYEQAYKNRTPDKQRFLMEEEAMAILAELYHYGIVEPSEVSPQVRGTLDRITGRNTAHATVNEAREPGEQQYALSGGDGGEEGGWPKALLQKGFRPGTYGKIAEAVDKIYRENRLGHRTLEAGAKDMAVEELIDLRNEAYKLASLESRFPEGAPEHAELQRRFAALLKNPNFKTAMRVDPKALDELHARLRDEWNDALTWERKGTRKGEVLHALAASPPGGKPPSPPSGYASGGKVSALDIMLAKRRLEDSAAPS